MAAAGIRLLILVDILPISSAEIRMPEGLHDQSGIGRENNIRHDEYRGGMLPVLESAYSKQKESSASE